MKKILIVDDAVDFLKTLKQALEKDFIIRTATGVTDALSLLDKEDVEFICSDLNMGDGTGLDLLTTLKQRNIDIPFVLMSGNDDCMEIRMAKYYGAVFVPKGIEGFLSEIKEIAYGVGGPVVQGSWTMAGQQL